MMIRHIIKYNRNRWNLAFFSRNHISNILSGDFSKIHWLQHEYSNRWFADPFILSVDDRRIIVLVEEMSYETKKGRLARLEIDATDYKLLDLRIILDLPTHLSFPLIYKVGDETYVMPENSASGQLKIYTYNDRKNQLNFKNIVCNEPLTDATICDINGDRFLFATKIPDQNGNVLHIYSLNSNFEATPYQTVLFDNNIARNAGLPFYYRGSLIRPAQDCNGDYGRGVILQAISFDQETKLFSFSNSGLSIYPFTYRYQKGLHTLNQCGDIFVIDARGYRYPVIGRIVRPIFNSIHQVFGI